MKENTMTPNQETVMPTEYRYFVVEYFAKPRNPNKTHVKNYIKDENNLSYDENVSFAKRIKNSVLVKATLILDLHECKIVKCRGNHYEDTSFPKLLKFYMENYANEFALYAPHLIPRPLEVSESVTTQ